MRGKLYVLFICCALLSCKKDSNSKFVLEHNSLSLITTEVVISNGDSFELQFKLSPSNYNVNTSNLSIGDTKPGTSDEHIPYTIVDVKRVSTGEQGDKSALWVATVQSDSDDEKPYGETTELFLVISSRSQYVKSTTAITVTNYPPLSEKIVSIHYPYAQSYMTLEVHDMATHKDAQLTSAYVYARLIEPMPCFYDKKWINMTVTLQDNTAPFIVTEVADSDKMMFQVTPTKDIFANDSRDYIPVKVNIKLSDKLENSISKQVEIKFYKSLIVLPAGKSSLMTLVN